MNKVYLHLSIAVVVINLVAQKSFAWGELGHEITGEIAQQLIERDPETKALLTRILGVEPLAVSAVWPDQVRDDERFKPFAPYHFSNLGEDGHSHEDKDANTILNQYPAILQDPKTSRSQKIIALRYLVHVIGDIHQPLHVSPEPDYGANACKVHIRLENQPKEKLTNQHSVWDTDLVEYLKNEIKKTSARSSYFGYKQVSRSLIQKYSSVLANPPTGDARTWSEESKALTGSIVYPDKLTFTDRKYCHEKAKTSETSPSSEVGPELPILDDAYFASKVPIVETRLVLSGLHIASTLKDVLRATRSTPVDGRPEASEVEILGDLLRSNR